MRRKSADRFAAADHIEVNSLPAMGPINRALAAEKLACNISSRASSVLVGLLLALNSDALITLPASLAQILEKQFGLVRIHQPFAPIAFPVRLLWHSSHDRDECHAWVRGELAALAGEIADTV
jgi:DNA-binding transcriptional LysR family regulator